LPPSSIEVKIAPHPLCFWVALTGHDGHRLELLLGDVT